MDPEFQRARLITLAAGLAIAAIATGAVFLVFRRFGGKGHFGLIGALVAFLFVCCVVLLLVARA